MRNIVISFVLLLGFQHAGVQADDINVSSRAGHYIGLSEAGINQFFGIPYAGAPIGELRWRPPTARAKSDETIDARRYGDICPQPDWHLNADLPQSEDCLTLNIWSPDVAPKTPLPVMFWIHGGSFKVGSNRWWVTEANRLAAKGVVVVSVNYRLGLLGRFSHPALSVQQGEQKVANFGLMDQVMALRWVQDNIAAFGGDTDNVTIFGYSAGAVSVNFLMAAPAAKGLFQHGISQSSAVAIPTSRQMSLDLPGRPSLESEGVGVAEKLGLEDATAAQLRALSVEQLLSYRLPPGSLNPVVDGSFVVEDLAAPYARGDLNVQSYMVGLDSWESSLATSMHAMPDAAYRGLMTRAHGFTPEQVSEVYGENREPYAVADELFADGFHGSSLWLAQQAHKAGIETYLYWFSYMPPAADPLPGVPHGGEVPYVFGTLEHRERIGKPETTAADRAVAEQVQNYWVRFAQTGNPNQSGSPAWDSLAKGNLWMDIGTAFSMKEDLMKARMDFWMQHYARSMK